MNSNETKMPAMPETFEGWAVLHGLYQVNWPAWKDLPATHQKEILAEAVEFLQGIARPKQGSSAAFQMLGHKGDLLFLHFRPSFDELKQVELGFDRLDLADFLLKNDSYVSYLELGVYEMTVKTHREMLAENFKPGTPEWKQEWQNRFEAQRGRVKERLFTAIPNTRYFCFYPMNKHRGEQANWYSLPIEKRQELMFEHGMIGRKYGDRVNQVITGSIGFDDWEWGVYLFAKDPIVFKKLIYEMRFDEASAAYGEFGPFVTGLRFQPEQIEDIFSGRVPGWSEGPNGKH